MVRSMGAPRFVHLTVKSSYSLLEGMVPIKKMAKALDKAGFPAVGITDLENLFGLVEASKYIAGAGVQPIMGCELPVILEEPISAIQTKEHIAYLPLLVMNQQGWKHLAKLVSESQFRKLDKGDAGIALEKVLELNGDLICLSGHFGRGVVPMAMKLGQQDEVITKLKQAFGDRFYMQLERHEWPGQKGIDEKQTEISLRELAAKYDVPLVATNDCRFVKAGDLDAFEVLIGIGDSCTMDDPNRRRFTPNHHIRSEENMLAAFADLPEACANTVAIAQKCAFLLEAVSVKKMFMPVWEFSGDKPVKDVLRDESFAGLYQRLEDYVYPFCDGDEAKAAAKARYEKQLEYELDIIIGMGFDGYFLITSDFIRWSKENGIPVGPGRGSGAGSLVAWSLQITDLDPIRWELYFERFLNPERVSLPDFDVDFCQDRREEVIAYVRRRYGEHRVANIITFGTLKAKACLRDVGRVLGMPYGFVGQVAAFIPEGANPPPIQEVLDTDERLKERYEQEDDVRRLVDTALQLEGCYRHASTHAAGVIICDRRVDEVCGVYIDPRAPMPVTQFSMGDAEYAGLVKFDFLGLKTLSTIRMAENAVKATYKPDFDIMKADLSDAKTYEMLKHGHTIGVFQIEGGGITELTKKMQADDMEALSAILALYRPGPLGTGMVDDYVNRKLGRAEAEYPHEILKPALEVTYGVPVYQEQIMQMARDMAGYTLGGADMLRRAMGKKKPEEMAKERAKFVKGAHDLHGIDEQTANMIFDLMDKFSGYGFNKAHTIAYALISFQTAYLKANYPHEFMAATMTYDRGNHDKLLRYKLELQKQDSRLLAPDVNFSEVMFAVEKADDGVMCVRHALAALKGAGEEAMRALVTERKKGGKFTSIWNFMERLEPSIINKRQLEVLIKAGALDGLDKRRDWLFTNMETLLAYSAACHDARVSGQGSLFGGGDAIAVDAAAYMAGCKPAETWDYLTKLQYEAEAVGFYVSSHPLDAFADELAKISSLKHASEIEQFAADGGGACRVAGLIQGIREVKTKKGDRMGVVTLSDTTGQVEVAFFPESYAACQQILEGTDPLVLSIKVQQDGERLRINADKVQTLSEVLGNRAELVLHVPDTHTLAQVKGVLDKAGQGQTVVRMIVPSVRGNAQLKLPRGFAVNPMMLAHFKGLGVLE
ncbi:MAG: DNA polymerase III subunit alpha [Blastochloris viridis]|uniref:DNA polymerase III subunit alpha n=1 Tax=Blastochloris viridis TaxID=1079 RepID=A0A6N4QYC4_BLAVI|nr:MAG: DNA polymerase III subunit alpha [Blastochloris viridis]